LYNQNTQKLSKQIIYIQEFKSKMNLKNINLKKLLLILCTAFIILIFLESCRKDPLYNNNPGFTLKFSTDTVMFDTVFTTVGTITKRLTVKNNSDRTVLISMVEIGGKHQSNFRFNINGRSGILHKDIEIRAKDSLWIFVEATIDPTNSNSPLLVQDSIIFHLNNKRQNIQLVAFGQDAYFHTPNVPATANFPAYSTISGVWPNDKPHVIYGLALVPNDSTLTIQSGTKVFMHNNSNLVVLSGGSLKINGSLGNEVVFRGDRLDAFYKDQPGAWGRIWLSAGSINNEIDYAIIQNGRIGIHVDTMGVSNNPTLKLKNTIIKNMSTAALLAQGAWIEAENCVFANSGEILVWLNIGGKYSFKHCTFGNYWSSGNRRTPSLIINNYYKDAYGNFQIRNLDKAFFGNCIIYGNKDEEIALDKYKLAPSIFNVEFSSCIVKTELEIPNQDAIFDLCLKNIDPKFERTDSVYFNLKTGSPAINAGSFIHASGIISDILGNSRISGSAPDMGAYEKE